MKRRSSASFAGSGNSSNKRRDTGSSLGLRGEDFGQRVPPIYDIIKNILQEYPSGQIFKEVIQNADDARATEVKFYLDYRNLETLPISLLQSQSGVSARDQEELSKQFTGPALLSYNNAPFREEDWEGIQTTYQSVKANSPNKVGKFGIGFNSVYHITDLPVIISEDTCVFLEPQLLVWNSKSGQRYSLEDLNDHCPEAVAPFTGIGGFSSGLSNFKGKTIFRFPLRNKPSKIWSEIYDISKLESLLSSLKQEAKYLLLFLRSVCSIEVLKINARGAISSIFNVSISQEHRSLHIQNQQKILRAIEDLTSKTSSLTLYGQMHIESSHFKVAVKDNETRSHIKHEFLVVHQVGSNNQKVWQLAEKQNVLPWVGVAVELVGVAVELNDLIMSFGRIFCVLPLPVEDRSPFYVHVNGTFAISSNRRSIKWEAQERRHDEQAMWNKMLVEDCLPFCYFKLISKLMDMKSPEVYNYWPDIGKVSGTQWSGLLKPFYNFLFDHKKIVHTQLDGGKWINISEAVFANHDVSKAVIDALLKCNVNLVILSGNCIKAIKNYYTGAKTDLSPAIARLHLKHYETAYIHVTRKDKLDILRYCLVDNNHADLVGLWLLPMADGSFQEFKRVAIESSFLCSSDYPSSLLPGVESKLVKMYDEDQKLHTSLYTIALYGQTQLVLLNEMGVSTLLAECNTRSWSQDQLQHFWEWLNKRNLSHFKNKKILPVKLPSGRTNILELKRQAGVVYIPQFLFGSNELIVASLKKCGMKFADAREFPYLSHSQLSQYIYQFDPNGILDAIELFTFSSINFLRTEALALQQFFNSSSFYDLNKLSTFSEMPLFEVLQYSDSTRYSLNSIKSYTNHVIAMSGRYDFKTDLIEDDPFIIDTYSHNDVQLLKALCNANVLCFMSETDYLLKIAFQQIKSGKFHNVVPFMLSVLDNFSSPRYKQQLTGALKDLPFIKTKLSGAFKSPCYLFDPENELLLKLFNGEDKFPGAEFKPYLPILRECGLKSSVSASEIFQIVNSICLQSTDGIAKTSSILYSKAMAVLQYLSSFPYLLRQKVSANSDSLLVALRRLNAKSCWLPVASKHPDEYPSCLEWRGSQYQFCLASAKSIGNPLMLVSEDLASSHLPLIAGSQAFFVEGVPTQLVEQLGRSQALIKAIASHFNEVIKNEHRIRKDLLLKISVETYTYLQENREFCSANTFAAIDNWVFIKNKFLHPQQIAIEANPTFEANLEPFVYVLPSNLSGFADIFSLLGVNHQVTPQQIFNVLQSIKYAPRNQINAAKAWAIVTAILEWLAEDTDRMGDGDVLVPVESKSSFPNLIPVQEVAYTNNEVLCNIANASGEEYHLIHPKVSHLSAELGITPLSDQLNITEDIFDDAGQHEPITTRLRNILKEYKDGLTIIKEMIQNADDAGATEVNILYDNRTHSTQNLIFKGMADSHGPALIVHNNGSFTKEDFENITKLAGATKANQPLKIGKFGIGFCSVYHITDVPSFVSGEWLYIFDPTLKYLKGIVINESRPGKKMKYQSKIFAKSQDLTPYEGLFGFKSSSDYEGTMFRFPFRTSASQISSTIYNEHLVEDIKRDLIECGSKLLLFLQHVKQITFSSLKGKKKIIEVSIDASNSSNDDIHKVVIKSPHNKSSTEHWLIASQEEQWRHQNIIKPAVASIACQFDRINSSCYKCKEIEGNAFCFLPLALPSTGLPVHVSANFAVMSNRSGIWTEASSGIVTDSREQWNKNLMEITIPEAYCKLLQKLQAMHCSGTLLDYDFHMLWPLATNLHMKYPWDFLVTGLIKLLSEKELFYSASLNKWQTLEQSYFIPSSLFSIVGRYSFPEEALHILQLPVVSLPPNHMQQLMKFSTSLSVLDEDNFTSFFLSNIASFNAHIQIRNKVIFCMLLAIAMSQQINSNEYENVKTQIKLIPCIPCSPNGINLKVANQLIDPVVFKDIFDPEDAMFPLSSFCQNNLVCNMLVEFGMMSEKLSIHIIIRSAKTIEPIIVTDKSKAMKRVKAILQNITSPVPDELKKMRFLPVLPKPQHYFIHWKGEGHVLLSPYGLICNSRSTARGTALIVGSQRAILNTNSVSDGGCGTIGQRVIKLLEIATKPSFDEVLKHLNTLIRSFKPSAPRGHYEIINEMCREIYTFFDELLDNPLLHESLSKYYNKPFIWTGKTFVCPWDVAINWNYHDGPYLYKLPSMLSEKDKLLKCFNIKTTFNYDDILVAFEAMYKDFASCKILKRNQNIALSMISELNSMTINSSQVSNYKGDIILIDDSYTLRHVSQLSFNDSPWLPPDNESFYVHNKLTREVALTLGVKPTCSRFLNKFAPQSQQSFAGVPFGQKEELTRRIRNILQEYPLDATFLKELLQNADDTKATKIRVILDKRQHKKKKVPSEEWGKELQGPALLVWNDKEFSDADLEGIQKLGLGSKRDDDESIGQFGIGFNVVYHLTDCPSFITRGNTLCVFDPHCKYVPEADHSCPGRQYNIDDNFLKGMSDLKFSFLRVSSSNIHLPDNLTTGTLFRFPLRTQSGFQSTELLDKTAFKKHISVNEMEEKLTEWVNEIEDALLFLNHIKQFSFYIIDNKHSSLKLSYEVNISQEDQKQREAFHQKLLSFRSSKEPFIVTYQVQLSIVKPYIKKTKRWLIQNGVGNISKSPEEQLSLDRVQPKYGIAAPLDGNTHIQGRVFCFLPLPVFTNLPVHVNGQFALHNNRRSLWNGDREDNKIKWNRFILQAIAYCYALLLDKARAYFISEAKTYSLRDASSIINSYYDLFPLFDKGGDSEKLEGDWHTLALNVVQHLYDCNTSVLAVQVQASQSKVKVEWCPLKSDNGFTQVYFQPEYVKSIIPVVSRIRMLVTCAPHCIYQTFKKVFDPPIVSPLSVFSFYTNFSSLILTSGAPVKLQESPFQTIQCFQEFLKYILCHSSEFPKSPHGYPLLLTSDDILRNFNQNDQVLFSSYFSLFSKSKDRFLHPELFNLSLSPYYFLSIDSGNLFSQVSKILEDNLPSKLKGDEAPSNVIDARTLKKLWDCITSDDYFIVYRNEIVQEWALLPARNNKLYSTASGVLPIVEPDMFDHAFNVLKDLNVPILKSEGYPQGIFDYCPSMTQCNYILDVIFHVCRKNEQYFTQKVTTLNDLQIKSLMSYLNKTSFHNDKKILDKILCLPLFKSINETVTKLLKRYVYLWPDPQFPVEAYDKWAPIDRIVFLERNGSWKWLCQNNFSLLGQELSPTEVYCDIIFPVFYKLDFEERLCHMEYIRKYLFPNLKHALQMTGEQSEQAIKFVNCAKKLPFLVSHSNDNKLYPVNHFVDHTMKIFNFFSDRFHFLVEEYRKKEWLDFLRFIGLRIKVTPEEFVEFCDEVSKSHCKDTSNVLVEYLFSTKATDIHKSPTLLSTICRIPFVCTADLSPLLWIAPSPNNTGFTCFNGAVSYDELNASLLWTVRPVIQLPSCCMSVAENNVLNQLRVVSKPSVTDVFKNIENISRSRLADFELMSTYTVSRTIGSASVVEVIKDNITFIHNHDSSLLEELSLVPFIPVSAEPNDGFEVSKPVLVNSMQVVMTINSSGSEKSTRFCPYINILPLSLHHLWPALSEAGVTYRVELKHIQYMLERLHQQCKDINNPNDKELVRNAMQALSDLLKDVTQETEKILKPLYLPTFDDQLVLSTKLVYRDRKVYYNHESPWNFSESQFKLFSIPLLRADDVSEKDLCCKLPRKLSPKRLSSVSHDKLESGIISQSHSKICERLEYLIKLCSASVYCDGLTKIFLKVSSDLSKPNAALIVNFIKNLQCKTVINFIACVTINSIKVGAIKAKFLFICDEDENYTFYSSDEINTIDMTLRRGLAHELCNVLARVVGNEAIKLNEIMYELLEVQSEEDFKSIMKLHNQDVNIDREYLISADDSMPKPGQPMARYWRSFLDHNVNNIFRPQEWVGYEKSDDNFIWAIILHQVEQEDVDNHFLRKYAIQIDNEDEIHEEIVSILCLYKLVRREASVAPNHHQEIVLRSGIQTRSSRARVETENDDLNSLRRKICEQLRLLWSLPDAERRRGVRRLYLQYHPDKAEPSKVSIYEEAFKFLKCQINRLENNLPLLDPDITESSQHTETSFGSHWESNFNQWDRSARNRRYGHGGGFQPQVDKIEAKRWMRQAKSDLRAMKGLLSLSIEEVSSQLIFMAHQVMEKALKAGMYALLGLNEVYLKRHELIVHARALSSCEGSLSELNNLVSNMEQYYLDTRYPNRHTRPSAPVDKYSLHQASDIAKRAEKVYHLIYVLVQ
ncbi:PREDICTED: sacsin-like [Amphimedon queenslandica]|uniref:HEPN domain-containing protein n=2 Tax=Amphimedon queenslandica TaxID=400682 RepID=A0AAN0J4G9_AMPQE|nr:PREDICTED: sacsin-like [Amphimedon queenslandica]|eukprot:XP_019851646.1 PREDICTED: sacsin-like [Amphimedon queenslandica]